MDKNTLDIINEVSMQLWVTAAKNSLDDRKEEGDKDRIEHAEKVSSLVVPEENPNIVDYIKQCIQTVKENPMNKDNIEQVKVIEVNPIKNLDKEVEEDKFSTSNH